MEAIPLDRPEGEKFLEKKVISVGKTAITVGNTTITVGKQQLLGGPIMTSFIHNSIGKSFNKIKT